MKYFLHPHAAERMTYRMAPAGIDLGDVIAVIERPVKAVRGRFGRMNAWGYGKNGVRIRVTYDPVSGEIRTVAIADERLK
jgi:hypothetical protein